MIAIESNPLSIIACAAIAIILTAILYWRNKSEAELSKPVKFLLATLRCLSLFLILILFLNILFTKKISRTSTPLVVCAIDNSKSMVLTNDSADVRNFFTKSYSDFRSNLNKHFTTKYLLFGNTVSEDATDENAISFNDINTNISSIFSYTETLYGNSDVNAAVIFTDGISTTGINPVIASESVTYPVYFVATGDTTSRNDMAITNIRYNKTAYLKGKCVFEISMKANGYNNKEAMLQIYDNGSLISSKKLNINANPYYSTFNIDFEPTSKGKHFYKFVIVRTDDDYIPDNNEKTCVVEVIEGKTNVRLISNGAHPDLGAISKALANNDSYEIESCLFEELDISTISNKDILVMVNLPDVSLKSTQLFEKINRENIPYLLEIGSKTSLSTLTKVIPDCRIDNPKNLAEDAYPVYMETFSSFTVSNELISDFSNFSPLTSPFGSYELPTHADVMLNQKINNVSTNRPLLATVKERDRRTAYIFGEGIWQWRIRDFVANSSFDAFDGMVNNLVYFLSLSETFKHFQIDLNNDFYQNEPIKVMAKLYNDSYELVNDADVQFVITNDEGTEYHYYLSKTSDGSYMLEINNMPAGHYEWKASTGSEHAEGAFNISVSDPEHIDLQARINDLQQIADKTGGKVFKLSETDELFDILKSNINEQKTYNYQLNKKPKDILPVLLAIIALLAAEWIIRRRMGIY